MSEITLESQLFEIIQNKEMPEYIKLAKVDMLVSLGVNLNIRDLNNETALMWAIDENSNGVAKFLIENGANVNVENNTGWTPLMEAAYRGNKEVVELLIKSGALVNAKDHTGSTALIEASYLGHKEVVELLIEKGADINAKDKSGWSAIDIAKNEEIENICKFYLRLGEERGDNICENVEEKLGTNNHEIELNKKNDDKEEIINVLRGERITTDRFYIKEAAKDSKKKGGNKSANNSGILTIFGPKANEAVIEMLNKKYRG